MKPQLTKESKTNLDKLLSKFSYCYTSNIKWKKN